jgi:hypothetical protein
LTEIDCSEAMLPEIKTHKRLHPAAELAPLAFDAAGNLLPF